MSSPSASLPPALAAIRGKKPLLYLLAGGLGGGLGAVLGESVSINGTGFWHTVISHGQWIATYAAVLATALFAAGEWHGRRELRPKKVAKVMLLGILSGFVAGGLAQAAFSVPFGSPVFHNIVVRTFCWGLLGIALGGLLSKPVPNLGFVRGSLAGCLGGGMGGAGAILVSAILADTIGRVVGLGTLGLALGLAMLVVEKLFREASLEVIWAPNETTNLNLGSQAVTIGGGEDHVFVRGLPHHFASIVFANGVIEYVETASGKRSPLKDGSRLEIGKLNLVVHAAK